MLQSDEGHPSSSRQPEILMSLANLTIMLLLSGTPFGVEELPPLSPRASVALSLLLIQCERTRIPRPGECQTGSARSTYGGTKVVPGRSGGSYRARAKRKKCTSLQLGGPFGR